MQMQGITKRFPGVLANDHVDFDVKSGEVHALLGENGAGKSTLMKILYGMYHPDEGQILLNGSSVTIASPTDAINLGIGMIHQHFMLVPTLTVAENVALQARPQEAELLGGEGAQIFFLQPALLHVGKEDGDEHGECHDERGNIVSQAFEGELRMPLVHRVPFVSACLSLRRTVAGSLVGGRCQMQLNIY